MRLYHAGPHGVSDLGEHLGVTNAAASQMIDRLVQQGLLLRAEDPRDRRMKNITLTPKGQTLIQQSIEARQRWMEDLTKALTPEEQDSIITALTILTGVARQIDREWHQPYCPPAENIVA
jgi:DNA-binding MarR family transcriptional regulator